jgi:hypothetical protein
MLPISTYASEAINRKVKIGTHSSGREHITRLQRLAF